MLTVWDFTKFRNNSEVCVPVAHGFSTEATGLCQQGKRVDAKCPTKMGEMFADAKAASLLPSFSAVLVHLGMTRGHHSGRCYRRRGRGPLCTWSDCNV